MTTDAARKAVFETPELLEHIISFLPATVIFAKVQRLSRAWKAAVDASPAIQTKLWLQPQEKTVMRPTSFVEQNTPSRILYLGTDPVPMYSCGLAVNQLLCLQGKEIDSLSVKAMDYSRYQKFTTEPFPQPFVIKCIGDFNNTNNPGRLATGSSHSCRDMYLTDPSITTGMLRVHYYDDEDDNFDSAVDAALRDPSGITVGLLLDMCWASVAQDIKMILNSDEESSCRIYAIFRFIGTASS